MKKLVMMAIMMVASATMFAGDTPALKAILKAKTYEEAEALLKSSINDLASNAEKAKAYNKIVDLALAKFNKEDQVRLTNQVKGETAAYDVEGMNQALVQALTAAIECDKYDQKYRKSNSSRLASPRISIINSGIELINSRKNEEALTLYAAFVNSAKAGVFNEDYLGAGALYGGISAYNLDKFDVAKNYLDIALNDTAQDIKAEAMRYRLAAAARSLKTKEDSVAYINEMKELLEKNPDNMQVYGGLGDALIQNGRTAELMEIVNARLAKNPEDELSHVFKGNIALTGQKFDEAIAEMNHVAKTSPFYPLSIDNKARSRFAIAAAFYQANSDERTGRMTDESKAKYKELLEAAKKDFDELSQLDPDNNYRWKYLLSNVENALSELK